MSLFQKTEVLLERDDIRLGEFNPNSPTGTCYDNVLTFPISVRKHRKLRLEMSSDKPIDVVIAHSDNSDADQKLETTGCTIGPVDTKEDEDMGILIGTYPGNKVNVKLRVWMDTK